jgi:hypothetical protein
MTELEWERSIEPQPMLWFLSARTSARKFQLFAVACCRQHWELFPAQPCRQAVNVAERFADGNATEEEVRIAVEACETHAAEFRWQVGFSAFWAATAAVNCGLSRPDACAYAETAASYTLHAVAANSAGGLSGDQYDNRAYQQVNLLHDVVGNPFRPVRFEQGWRTSDAVALARRFYQTRDVGLLPILADALQDAGCDSADILDHCRGPGPHVRGCWVVDLILGKE